MRISLSLSIIILVSQPTIANCQVLENFKAHVEFLASDRLEGRGPGSRGLQLSAEYIVQQFEDLGLQPLNEKSYYQKFTIPGQEVIEANVIGIIPAKTSTHQSLVFTAHYDGLGIRKDALGVHPNHGEQDSIYNGALDNAVGVAALIEMARGYRNKGSQSQNLVFIATAAEERGHYGSIFYVNNPAFPLDQVSINLNIDGFCIWGKQEEYFMMPQQGIDYVDKIDSIASTQGWVNNPPDFVDDLNKLFDATEFLSRGIPAITIWSGNKSDVVIPDGQLPLGRRTHTPYDEVNQYWDWGGVEAQLGLYKLIADYFLEHPGNVNVTNPELFVH